MSDHTQQGTALNRVNNVCIITTINSINNGGLHKKQIANFVSRVDRRTDRQTTKQTNVINVWTAILLPTEVFAGQSVLFAASPSQYGSSMTV